MSIVLMSQAYKIKGLTTAQKAVLLCLCDHANEDGNCFPSMGRIAGNASVSERTVYRCISELEAMGYVTRVSVPGRSCRFTVDLSRPDPCQIVTPDTVADAPDTVADAPDTVSPITINNRQEPSKGKGNPKDCPAFSDEELVEGWNELAGFCGLPKVGKLTQERKRRIKVRRNEYPDLEDWQKAFQCIRRNKWMHGDNPRGWRADFDFLLQAKSFTRLTEGAYEQV